MGLVWQSFRRSFESLLSLRILILLALPLFLSFALWFMVLFGAWGGLVPWVESLTKGLLFYDFWSRQFPGFEGIAILFHGLAIFFVILFFLPLVYLTSLLLTSLLVLPYLVQWVSDEDYPHLEKRYGGSLWGSVWNSIKASIVFMIGLTLSLPLWIVPGLQVILPILLMSSLNRKIFVYDSLQDFATAEERQYLLKRQGSSFFTLGLVNGFLTYIPFVVIFVPFLTTLSFLHLSLSTLDEHRKQKNEGQKV